MGQWLRAQRGSRSRVVVCQLVNQFPPLGQTRRIAAAGRRPLMARRYGPSQVASMSVTFPHQQAAFGRPHKLHAFSIV